MLVLWKASVTSNEDLRAEGFGALCMLCAEIANWVRNWSQKPFFQKSCAPLLLMAGIESGDQKEMYRNFYCNFIAISRNFPQFFQAWGTANPPPPQLSERWLSDSTAARQKPIMGRVEDFGLPSLRACLP